MAMSVRNENFGGELVAEGRGVLSKKERAISTYPLNLRSLLAAAVVFWSAFGCSPSRVFTYELFFTKSVRSINVNSTTVDLKSRPHGAFELELLNDSIVILWSSRTHSTRSVVKLPTGSTVVPGISLLGQNSTVSVDSGAIFKSSRAIRISP